jgi:hypothetical protein
MNQSTAIADLLIGLFVGFGLGYGVREFLSRRRRAAERTQYYERHPEERRD